MIDAHCHILPGIDDGPRDIAESIEMAEIAAADGITKIIATPHISDTSLPPGDIEDLVDQLNFRLNQKNIPVRIYPGAEVSITTGPEKLTSHTINRSPYILVEFPHDHLPSFAGSILKFLCARGLKPIIAHPERNYSIIRSPETLLNFLNKNVHIQITAASLTGEFGRDIQYCANYLLDSGNVDIIASDAHSRTARPPQLSAAVRHAAKRIGKTAARQLVTANPGAILNGKDLHTDTSRI